MVDLKDVSRVVCDHQWHSVSEWVHALDTLAEMTETEIEGLFEDRNVAATPAATA